MRIVYSYYFHTNKYAKKNKQTNKSYNVDIEILMEPNSEKNDFVIKTCFRNKYNNNKINQ